MSKSQPSTAQKNLFYIGARVDENTLAVYRDEPVYLDPKDLSTHAMVLGMTGSGKTGACLVLLEEAILSGIPAILVDPKGDLTNLLLAFPELKTEDFEAWVSVAEAKRQGLSVREYAEKVAKAWRRGLSAWGIRPDRIRALKESAEIFIFTPGASFGTPVSIIHSLNAPSGLSWEGEGEEVLRDRIRGITSALLSMIGHESDPVRSGEHILISNIIEYAWRNNLDLDLASLIEYVKEPPISRLGVIEVDEFLSPKRRRRLAVDLNKILASPSFESWITGVPLDINFFFGEGKKPRVSIFYVAHLGEREKQFFLTLLLWELYSWMLTQPGASTVRNIFYFDEIYGYLPPHPYSPPTKRPLSLLLKQGRAFGLSCILATQNPVDVDYKALSNCGIWIIGKLQTMRDRNRVLEGLTSVFEDQGASLDRQTLSRIISSLPPRTFVLHSAKREKPLVFRTRHLMVYHRGPITKSEVQKLTERQKELLEPFIVRPKLAPRERVAPTAAPRPEARPLAVAKVPPIANYYLNPRRGLKDCLEELKSTFTGYEFSASSGGPVYHPALYCMAEVYVKRKRPKAEISFTFLRLIPLDGETIDWDSTQAYGVPADAISKEILSVQPKEAGEMASLPPILSDTKGVKLLKEQFLWYAKKQASTKIYYHPKLKIYSKPGMTKEEFTQTVQQEIETIQKTEERKIDEELGEKERQLLLEIEDRQTKLEEKKKILEEIRREYREKSALIRETRKQVESVKKEIKRLESHLKELVSQEKKLKAGVQRAEKMQMQIKKLEDEIKSLNRQLKERKKKKKPTSLIQTQIKSRKKKISQLKKQVKSLNTFKKALNKLQKEINQTTSSLGKLQKRYASLLKKLRKYGKAENVLESLQKQKEGISKEIKKLNDEIRSKRKQLMSIRKEKQKRTTRMMKLVQSLKDAEIKEFNVHPKKAEVSISLFDLVWVPLYDVQIEVSQGGKSGLLLAHWNGYTGEGWVGVCKTCGSAITDVSELRICQECLSALCTKDAIECVGCGGIFCKEDYDGHLAPCGLCGRELCPSLLELCPLCGRSVCANCLVTCSACGSRVCLDDAWTCVACGRQFCNREPKFVDQKYGGYLCQDCAVQCGVCGRVFARRDAERCPECGSLVCPDCMVETRRFLVLKKRVCKRCAGVV